MFWFEDLTDMVRILINTIRLEVSRNDKLVSRKTLVNGKYKANRNGSSFFPVENELRKPFNVQSPFEGAAAVHVAMMNLNTGDGSVIPEVQGFNERCNIRFTFEIFDTEKWEISTVHQVIETLDRE